MASRQSTRVDDDKSLADAWLVAFVNKKAAGLKTELRADERGDEQLHHQGQHGAFGAGGRAHGQHRTHHASARVGGGFAVVIKRPAQWDGTAFFGRDHEFAACHFTERQVDEQWVALAARKHRCHRVGAEEGPAPTCRRHGRRRVGKADGHQACGASRAQVVHHHTAVVAVAHPGKSHAVGARGVNRLGHGQVARREGQALLCVDEQRTTFAMFDGCHSRAIGATVFQVRGVLRHPRKTMRAHALCLSQGQSAGGAVGHRGVGASGLQGGSHVGRGLRHRELGHQRNASKTLSAMRKLTRSLASKVTPATCGVNKSLGQLSR